MPQQINRAKAGQPQKKWTHIIDEPDRTIRMLTTPHINAIILKQAPLRAFMILMTL
jgi:hypothetical protein